MSDADREHLAKAADRTIAAVKRQWEHIKNRRSADYDETAGDALGWMNSDAYLALAAKSMEDRVRRPLRQRHIPITA